MADIAEAVERHAILKKFARRVSEDHQRGIQAIDPMLWVIWNPVMNNWAVIREAGQDSMIDFGSGEVYPGWIYILNWTLPSDGRPPVEQMCFMLEQMDGWKWGSKRRANEARGLAKELHEAADEQEWEEEVWAPTRELIENEQKGRLIVTPDRRHGSGRAGKLILP